MSTEPGSLSQSTGDVAGTGSDCRRRLVWVQLGIPDPHFSYAGDNILLAAGYTLAGCRHHAALSGWSLEILDSEICNWAGDAALLAAILERRPDAVCFSCFVWNVERSLWLGQQIKLVRPAVWLIFGGPEIHPDSPFWQTADADALVCGEGETGLPLAITGLDGQATRPLRIMAPLLENLSGLPDPYSEGILTPGPDGNCYLETMRGCPYRCQYCFYSKRNRRMRFHDEAALEHFFRWTYARGDVRDVYLVDPSFNVTPALPERLRRLARLNRDRIPLHTEIRLEGITPELAGLFREAGFESVEVGLQSIHPEVCAGVGRHLDLESFRRGAAAMKRAGIRLELGIILGLPGDDLDGFTATVQWLADHDLADETVVFILSLLPGTELRARADREGWHFMDGPPYYLLEGGGWHRAALLEALYRMEDILDQSHYPEWLPVIEGMPTTRFRTELELNLGQDDESAGLMGRLPDLAAVLCLRVHMNGSAADIERLKRLGREFSHSNPFSLTRLLIEAPQSLTDDSFAEIRDAFAGEEGYWERLNFLRDRRPGRSRCHIFQMIPRVNPDRFIRSLSPERDIVWELPDNPDDFLRISRELIHRDLASDVYLINRQPLDEAYLNEIRALGSHRFAGWLSVEGE